LWTKSLLCNDSHEIQSNNTKERIANGEFIPRDIEERRKQAVFARSHKKKKRNLLTHRLSSQKNIEQYNILQKRVSEMTKVKEEPKRKEYPSHIKSFIESYAKKDSIPWNKGKKTSEETKKKQSISAQMRHSLIKEFK
jgi:hypothetical protein